MNSLTALWAIMAEGLPALSRFALNSAGQGRRQATRVDGIDRQALEIALARQRPGLELDEVKVLHRHDGTSGRIYATVAYHVGSGQPPLPQDLFIKQLPIHRAGQLMACTLGIGLNEARIYDQITPLLPLKTPRCYGCWYDERDGNFLIVLEILPKDSTRFPDILSSCSLEEARHVVTGLARMHAAFWQHPRFAGDLSWVLPQGTGPRGRLMQAVPYFGIGAALKKFPDMFAPEVHRLGHRIRHSMEGIYREWRSGPLTLVHGDTHLGNMYFDQTTTAAGLLDWQVAHRGQGMRDIAYFLITSLDTEFRRAHQAELLTLYHQTLAAQLPQAPTRAELERQYRFHSIYAWLGAVITRAAQTMQSDRITEVSIARVNAALLEMQVEELLPH